ncbi:MAG: hypothetical protein R3B70_22035 [Polyangiaceae bacterium]
MCKDMTSCDGSCPDGDAGPPKFGNDPDLTAAAHLAASSGASSSSSSAPASSSSSSAPSGTGPAPMDGADLDDGDDEKASPGLRIDLADIHPAAHWTADQLREMQRQVELQVEGLGQMTVSDWLFNALLNRMKSTDVQSSRSAGTTGGFQLASLVDTTLWRDDGIAHDFMVELAGRLEGALRAAPSKHRATVTRALEAAREAASAPLDVYTTFRTAGGLDALEAMNHARLVGGLGRQHGAGDEQWFREQFADGIALLERDPMFTSNNVLHNPDQCAGGSMLVLSQEEWRALSDASHEYERARLADSRARHLVTSYAANPPSRDTADELKADLDASAADAVRAAAQLAAAERRYMDLMLPHLGNGGVNRALGGHWMEPVGYPSRTRVDTLLRAVLDAYRAGNRGQRLDVRMRVGAQKVRSAPPRPRAPASKPPRGRGKADSKEPKRKGSSRPPPKHKEKQQAIPDMFRPIRPATGDHDSPAAWGDDGDGSGADSPPRRHSSVDRSPRGATSSESGRRLSAGDTPPSPGTGHAQASSRGRNRSRSPGKSRSRSRSRSK